MNTERDYLYLAVEKAGCVVMVRHFDSAEKIRRSKIEYISDNVERIGMNIQTVKKGYRLPEDYIHPDDREGSTIILPFRSRTVEYRSHEDA